MSRRQYSFQDQRVPSTRIMTGGVPETIIPQVLSACGVIQLHLGEHGLTTHPQPRVILWKSRLQAYIRCRPGRQRSTLIMPAEEKVKGPASYFPSIEKTYGKPVSHWLDLLDSLQDRKHMEQVAFLKAEHGMGHGHANALVAYHRAQKKS